MIMCLTSGKHPVARVEQDTAVDRGDSGRGSAEFPRVVFPRLTIWSSDSEGIGRR